LTIVIAILICSFAELSCLILKTGCRLNQVKNRPDYVYYSFDTTYLRRKRRREWWIPSSMGH